MKPEELLLSTNLDDIILGLNIIKKPKDKYKINYSGTCMIVYNDVTFIIHDKRITKYNNHSMLDLEGDIALYHQFKIPVKDFRTK